MSAKQEVRFDIDAVNALATWEAKVSTCICNRAKQLAAQSGQASRVTVSHFQRAASVELRLLAQEIDQESPVDGQEEAA